MYEKVAYSRLCDHGFRAEPPVWCDNNRILIGTRRYMEQEGVTLPEQDYEDGHSKNGELQILYLAVSGNPDGRTEFGNSSG